MVRLEQVVPGESQPVALGAHNLGCHLVPASVARSRLAARVRAAFPVAKPAHEGDDAPPQVEKSRPIVRSRLLLVAAVVVIADDPYPAFERASLLAADRYARLVAASPCGHLDADPRLGSWPTGQGVLNVLADRFVA